LISSRLRGRAAQWLHSRSEYIEMTMDGLLEKMRSAFDCRPSRMERRKKFESRTWNSGETFADYYHEKLILANQVPIDDSELMDYLIDEIGDASLRNQTRIHQYDSTGAVLEAFQKIIIQPEARDRLKRGMLGER